ncbi:MAG: alpha/beta hydrolase-fold protein [Bacteroidota bacterium]
MKFSRLKHSVAAILLCILALKTDAQKNKILTTSKPFVIGHTITMHSAELREERILNIYLPEGYTATDTLKYPVIYLLDGSADEDFIHIAGLVQFAGFSWIKLLPPTIVVGIANVDRKRDFTFEPTDTTFIKEFPTSGHSNDFIRFIEKELQPLIKKEYRTSEERTIIGQSFGGLLATEIALKQPALFNNYIIISPSLWWDDESLLRVKSEVEYKSVPNGKIYLAVGKEGKKMVNDSKTLNKYFHRNVTPSKQLRYEYFKNEDHATIMHLAVYNAFKFFSKNR